MADRLPILAHGEVYAAPIVKGTGNGPKTRPHEYDEAKTRLLADIARIDSQVATHPEQFLKERIICIRMEPKFEAKSYTPMTMIRSSEELSIVGGRRYSIIDEKRDDQASDSTGSADKAKLYFVKTTDSGLNDLAEILREGTRDSVESWRNEVTSIRSLDLLGPKERTLGFDDDWTEGMVEVVLHPLNQGDEAIALFCRAVGIKRSEIEVRSYDSGVTFIAAKLTREMVDRASLINSLRTLHPLGRIVYEPMRSMPTAEAPMVAQAAHGAEITVGVFDGGCNARVPLLKDHVTAHDCVASPEVADGVDHGTMVCGAVLYGELSGKGAADTLPSPAVAVESFRVLPPSNPQDFELYESIDAIECVVSQRPDIRVYNLSFGPAGPILDDDISRFTYSLDRLSFSRECEPPLFCVAIGNDGERDYPMNRVQSPSDLINGIAVGAYSFNSSNQRVRASYSCIGPGREGAKVKPDLLEFGGDFSRPFVGICSVGNALCRTAGTSFASPLVVHKLGRMLADSSDLTPHLARTILLHSVDHDESLSSEEYGFGLSPLDADDCLKCDANKVTTLYQGMLKPKQVVSLPIFAPDINNAVGMVTIEWTLVAVCDTDPNDSDSYASSCVVDTFIPHAMKYRFSKKSCRDETLDMLTEEGQRRAEELKSLGYSQSLTPVSKPSKKYWDESVLRAVDFKWDTVIKRGQRMRSSSLFEPSLTLQSIFRDNGDSEAVTRYFAAVTVSAPGYRGSLYDATLQRYQNLQPIRLRAEHRIQTALN